MENVFMMQDIGKRNSVKVTSRKAAPLGDPRGVPKYFRKCFYKAVIKSADKRIQKVILLKFENSVKVIIVKMTSKNFMLTEVNVDFNDINISDLGDIPNDFVDLIAGIPIEDYNFFRQLDHVIETLGTDINNTDQMQELSPQTISIPQRANYLNSEDQNPIQRANNLSNEDQNIIQRANNLNNEDQNIIQRANNLNSEDQNIIQRANNLNNEDKNIIQRANNLDNNIQRANNLNNEDQNTIQRANNLTNADQTIFISPIPVVQFQVVPFIPLTSPPSQNNMQLLLPAAPLPFSSISSPNSASSSISSLTSPSSSITSQTSPASSISSQTSASFSLSSQTSASFSLSSPTSPSSLISSPTSASSSSSTSSSSLTDNLRRLRNNEASRRYRGAKKAELERLNQELQSLSEENERLVKQE